MDVETPFIYGEIEEEIHMKLPVGMKEVFSDPHETDEENTPTIKGNMWLMPISKAVLEKFVNQMMKIDIGFKISEADPCLLYREDILGICMIIMYVDNMMVIGHKE